MRELLLKVGKLTRAAHDRPSTRAAHVITLQGASQKLQNVDNQVPLSLAQYVVLARQP